MVVGLLWADQNMRDFGDQYRLLTSSERVSLFNILQILTEEERESIANNQYYNELSTYQAKLDNVILYK